VENSADFGSTMVKWLDIKIDLYLPLQISLRKKLTSRPWRYAKSLLRIWEVYADKLRSRTRLPSCLVPVTFRVLNYFTGCTQGLPTGMK
jgi:hypothetical protein